MNRDKFSTKIHLNIKKSNKPTIHVIAGVNGSGKTTIAYEMIPNVLKENEFLNADEIARGLSPFNFENYNLEAGKILLKRFDGLIKEKKSFVIETTLTSVVVNKKILNAKSRGFELSLFYVWIISPELAFERIKMRYLYGGHFINYDTIKRRYIRSIKNLKQTFIDESDYILILDNSLLSPEKVAEKKTILEIYNHEVWNEITK